MQPLKPIQYVTLIHSKKILFQSGLKDIAIPVVNAQRLQEAMPKPYKVIWYDTGHDLNNQACLYQLNWLREITAHLQQQPNMKTHQ